MRNFLLKGAVLDMMRTTDIEEHDGEFKAETA